jgi:hypothetical protein
MRVIIIDDKDARALLDRLELRSFEKLFPGFGVAQHDAWNALPNAIRDELISNMHKRFHFVVCSWLQEQGASVVR